MPLGKASAPLMTSSRGTTHIVVHSGADDAAGRPPVFSLARPVRLLGRPCRAFAVNEDAAAAKRAGTTAEAQLFLVVGGLLSAALQAQDRIYCRH